MNRAEKRQLLRKIKSNTFITSLELSQFPKRTVDDCRSYNEDYDVFKSFKEQKTVLLQKPHEDKPKHYYENQDEGDEFTNFKDYLSTHYENRIKQIVHIQLDRFSNKVILDLDYSDIESSITVINLIYNQYRYTPFLLEWDPIKNHIHAYYQLTALIQKTGRKAFQAELRGLVLELFPDFNSEKVEIKETIRHPLSMNYTVAINSRKENVFTIKDIQDASDNSVKYVRSKSLATQYKSSPQRVDQKKKEDYQNNKQYNTSKLYHSKGERYNTYLSIGFYTIRKYGENQATIDNFKNEINYFGSCNLDPISMKDAWKYAVEEYDCNYDRKNNKPAPKEYIDEINYKMTLLEEEQLDVLMTHYICVKYNEETWRNDYKAIYSKCKGKNIADSTRLYSDKLIQSDLKETSNFGHVMAVKMGKELDISTNRVKLAFKAFEEMGLFKLETKTVNDRAVEWDWASDNQTARHYYMLDLDLLYQTKSEEHNFKIEVKKNRYQYIRTARKPREVREILNVNLDLYNIIPAKLETTYLKVSESGIPLSSRRRNVRQARRASDGKLVVAKKTFQLESIRLTKLDKLSNTTLLADFQANTWVFATEFGIKKRVRPDDANLIKYCNNNKVNLIPLRMKPNKYTKKELLYFKHRKEYLEKVKKVLIKTTLYFTNKLIKKDTLLIKGIILCIQYISTTFGFSCLKQLFRILLPKSNSPPLKIYRNLKLLTEN